MDPPPELQAAARDSEHVTITTREYDDETVVAVDFGPVEGKPALDIVDDTAIVIVGETQFEFGVPPDAEDVAVNDGILTIRGSTAHLGDEPER